MLALKPAKGAMRITTKVLSNPCMARRLYQEIRSIRKGVNHAMAPGLNMLKKGGGRGSASLSLAEKPMRVPRIPSVSPVMRYQRICPSGI
jgi:hypothetical protein